MEVYATLQVHYIIEFYKKCLQLLDVLCAKTCSTRSLLHDDIFLFLLLSKVIGNFIVHIRPHGILSK